MVVVRVGVGVRVTARARVRVRVRVSVRVRARVRVVPLRLVPLLELAPLLVPLAHEPPVPEQRRRLRCDLLPRLCGLQRALVRVSARG